MNRPLEVCINADQQGLLADNICTAVLAGAKRIELCSAMQCAGLTPGIDATEIATKAINQQAELLVMIRPYAGDFSCSPELINLMCQQIETLAACGATGAVFGVLNQHHKINVDGLYKLQECCLKLDLKSTFHRAFDCISDPISAIKQLVEVGITRILTNGTPWGSKQSAEQGLDKLKGIIDAAAGNIEVVIGGGITPENSPLIWRTLHQQQTDISLHAYSGVHTGDITSATLIETLINGSTGRI